MMNDKHVEFEASFPFLLFEFKSTVAWQSH